MEFEVIFENLAMLSLFIYFQDSCGCLGTMSANKRKKTQKKCFALNLVANLLGLACVCRVADEWV